jgi:hypothetical protein
MEERYNLELYKLFNEPDIIKFIKMKSLQWAVHLIRISENRIIIVFNIKSEGTMKVGRPKLRWEECVWQGIRILGVKKLEDYGMEYEEWRAHPGR